MAKKNKKTSNLREMKIRFSDLEQASSFTTKLKSTFSECSFSPNREQISVKVPAGLETKVRELAYEFTVRSLSTY